MRRLLATFGRDAFRVELQRPLARHDRALNRGLAGLAARLGVATVATGNVHAHSPERARLQDVFVAIREHTTLDASEPLRRGNHAHVLSTPQAMAARFADHPEAVAETAAPRRDADLRPHAATSATATPAPRTRPPSRALAEVCAARFDERYPRGSPHHEEAKARLEEELRVIDELGLAGFFLLHRDLLELAREVAVEVRGRGGADGATNPRSLLPPGRGRGSSVSSIVCHLTGLSHVDPIANKLLLGPLPQRGAHRAAGHRPRLPARHPRGPDPARARALRPRALGARRGLPDVPRARRDPRDRQGARAAAGGDRARRARQRGLVVARRRPRHRHRARRGPADRPLGLARAPGRRGLRPAAPSLPALRRDDRRDAPARRLRAARAGRDGGPPARAVGQGLLRRRGLSEDRPARPRDAVRRRALRRPHRPAPRRAHRPQPDPLRRPRDVRVHPERRDDRRLSDRVARADGLAAAHAPGDARRHHDPGRDRPARADRRRRGQPVHRAPPAAARRSLLRGPLPAPVARAAAARHARDDHLPRPGARGRAGVRRLQRGGGRGAAPGDEPQALGGGAGGLPPALRRRGAGQASATSAGSAPRRSSRWSRASRASAFPRPTAPPSACSPTSRRGCACTTGRSFSARCSTSSRWASIRPTRSSTRRSGAGSTVLAPEVNASEVGCTVRIRPPARPDRPAVQVGLGYVLGVRREEVAALVAARHAGGPFASLEDLASRAGAGRAALEKLAWSGACDDARRRRSPRRAVAARGDRARRAGARARGRAARAGARPAGAAEARGRCRPGTRWSPTTRRPG